jgi:PAS domain S-box-containing protein
VYLAIDSVAKRSQLLEGRILPLSHRFGWGKQLLAVRTSFQTKLLLAMLLPLLFIAVVFTFASASLLERQHVFVGEQQASSVKLLANELSGNIGDRMAVLQAVASGLNVEQLLAPGYAASALAQQPGLKPLFPAGVIVYDQAGTVLGDLPVLPGRQGTNFGDREYMQRLFATRAPVVSRPFKGRLMNVMLFSMCVPIVSAQQQIAGAICGLFAIQEANFFARLSDPKALGNNEFYLLDPSDRIFIASSDRQRVMARLPESALVTQLLKHDGQAFVEKTAAGVEKVFASAVVLPADWVLVLSLPTAIAYAPIWKMQSELLKLALLASVLVVLASYLLARRMLRPLKEAGAKLDAMSSGSAPLQRIAEAGDSEIRNLLVSFNRLSGNIASQNEQILDERNALQAAEDQLRELNQNLEIKVFERTLELKQANQALDSQKEFVHKVTNAVPCMIGYWDRNLQCRFANKVYESWFKEDVQTLVGMHVSAVLEDKLFDFNLHLMQSALAGSLQSFQSKVQRADGSTMIVSAHYIPDRVGEEVVGFFVLGEDVTEIKDAELRLHALNDELAVQARVATQANAAKSDFLANMSHEIRTPLSAISGMAKLIAREPLNASQTDRMKKLESAIKHLGAIISDILDLSKIEANKLILEEGPVSLEAIFNDVANMLQETMQEKGLALHLEMEPLQRFFVGDATRLGQALLNYASNAVKFTEHGSVSLRCRVQEESADSALLRFEVQDSGLGISPEKLATLFSPFVQADTGTTRKFGGTGLGLVIAKRLAQAMGGEAGAHSEVGKGSTFWFTARLTKGDVNAQVALQELQTDAAEQLKAGYAGLRVLLAEDDDFNREIGAILLEEVGLLVDVAVDGQLAVAMAGQTAYDLILMDMQMPRMDGLEATRHIRSTPGGKDIPIIAMTANAFAEDRIRCLEAGMNEYLTKPVDPNVLYHMLLRQFAKAAKRTTVAR